MDIKLNKIEKQTIKYKNFRLIKYNNYIYENNFKELIDSKIIFKLFNKTDDELNLKISLEKFENSKEFKIILWKFSTGKIICFAIDGIAILSEYFSDIIINLIGNKNIKNKENLSIFISC